MLLFNLWIDSMNLNWLEKFELPHKRFCPPNIIWIYLSESARVIFFFFLLWSMNLITEFVGFFVVFWILIAILIFVERWFLFGKMYHSDWKWLSPVALLLSPYVMLCKIISFKLNFVMCILLKKFITFCENMWMGIKVEFQKFNIKNQMPNSAIEIHFIFHFYLKFLLHVSHFSTFLKL